MSKIKKIRVNMPYYVGSTSVQRNGSHYGSQTLAGAINQAKKKMEDDDLDLTYVVKVVRVVRRASPPVEVLEVE